MADDFVLSASSLNTYLRCARQWWFAYVEGIKSPPSLRAARGIAVHAAVETSMRQKMATRQDLPVNDWLDAYSTAYDQEISNGFEAKKDETPGVVKDAGVVLTKIYAGEVAPTIQPVMVEEPIQFDINGQVWTGQIDIGVEVPVNLYGEPEYGIMVRDTKTSSRSPAPESYAVNMTGYALAVRQRTGKPEAGVAFDYLVATKSPYYMEIVQDPVSDEQIRSFAWLVGDVRKSIDAGAFPANGLNNTGACDWCGYRGICPAYAAKNPNKG